MVKARLHARGKSVPPCCAGLYCTSPPRRDLPLYFARQRIRGAPEGLIGDMADQNTIRRTLHFKFTLPGASDQMIAMMKSAAPLYQVFGDAKVRLLQNVDDPNRFLQEIDYQAHGAIETNRQQLASDPRVQAYLQAWKSMFPGAIEIEVFKVL